LRIAVTVAVFVAVTIAEFVAVTIAEFIAVTIAGVSPYLQATNFVTPTMVKPVASLDWPLPARLLISL
jgi:hypothetical protein